MTNHEYKGKITQKDIGQANRGLKIYNYCISKGIDNLNSKDLIKIKNIANEC